MCVCLCWCMKTVFLQQNFLYFSCHSIFHSISFQCKYTYVVRRRDFRSLLSRENPIRFVYYTNTVYWLSILILVLVVYCTVMDKRKTEKSKSEPNWRNKANSRINTNEKKYVYLYRHSVRWRQQHGNGEEMNNISDTNFMRNSLIRYLRQYRQ